MLYVHVHPVAPLGASHMTQPDIYQHKGGIAAWDAAYHTGAVANHCFQPLWLASPLVAEEDLVVETILLQSPTPNPGL